MFLRKIFSIALVLVFFSTSVVLAASNNAFDLETPSAIMPPEGHSYDYSEPIENPGPTTTKVIQCEMYAQPIMASQLLPDGQTDTSQLMSGRLIYGSRILETFVPGSYIYYTNVNGLYDAVKSSVIHVASLLFTTPVSSYLYSVITGFNPYSVTTVGIQIGYAYNTYIRTTQIQSAPGGAWETYYTAYRYDYFRYDRVTVTNPNGYNPPLLEYAYNPSSTPNRVGLSPNFDNYGELSQRGSLLYLNYCPAGWETETNMYYPLVYA